MLIFPDVISILARRTLLPSGYFPSFISRNNRKFSSGVRSRYGLFFPGSVKVPRYSLICSAFRSQCCSGDLADLKVKSVDVEAWSPRQKKYFEVGSCSNLGDAQARRLRIRIKGENGNYFAHTLNNTVVAPPRMLIAFLENNLREDGSVAIPEVLRPYMGGKESLQPKK